MFRPRTLTLLAVFIGASAAAQSPDLRPASDVELGPPIADVGDREVVGVHASGAAWSFHGDTVILHSTPERELTFLLGVPTRLAPTADHESLWAFGVVGPEAFLWRVDIVDDGLASSKVTCQDRAPLLELTPPNPVEVGPLHALREWPDGRVCATDARTFLCLDPGDPDAPLQLVKDSALYAAALPAFDPPPEAFENRSDDDRVPSLSYLDALWVEGRFVVLADLEFAAPPYGKPVGFKAAPVSGRLLFEERPDGSLHVLAPPTWISRDKLYRYGYSPLVKVERLFHWQEHDVLAMWPSHPTSHCWLDPDQAGWDQPVSPFASPRNNPLGARGTGYAIVPLDGPGLGLLTMFHAFHRTLECYLGIYAGFDNCYLVGPGGPVSTPDGGLLHSLGHMTKETGKSFALHPVIADFDRLDLDGDRLRGAAERAAGTSDFLRDTDGGGDPDGAEVDVLGQDPLSPTDDLQRHAVGETVHYSPSELIQLRLPDKGPRMAARTWGTAGPLCAGGECFDATGRVVATWPNPLGAPASRSVDGLTIWSNSEAGITTTRLADGMRRHVIDRGDLADLFEFTTGGPAPLTIVPLDSERAWIVSEAPIARVAYFEDGQMTVRYDGETVRCDNKMGPCEASPFPTAVLLDRVLPNALPGGVGGMPPVGPPAFAPDINPTELLVMGYEPTTARLMISVYGTWDLFEIGLHATDAAIVQRDASAMRVEDSLDDEWFIGHVPVPAARWHPTGYGDRFTGAQIMLPGGAARASAVEIVSPSLVGAWNTTLVQWDNSLSGPLELVRAMAGEADPGDVLAFGQTSSGSVLYRSTPRGGLFPVYRASNISSKNMGMGVSPSGRVCLAGSNHFVELGADALWGGAPRVVVNDGFAAHVTDCAYSADGSLYFLIFEQGKPWQVVSAADGTVLEEGPAGVAVDDSQLIRTADGALRVVSRDATEVAGELPAGTSAPEQLPSSLFGPVVVRPDGLVIGTNHRHVIAVDPATDQLVNLSPIEFFARPSLGRLPGGVARDPWPQALDPKGAAGVVTPVAESDTDTTPAASGCAVQSEAPTPHGLALLLILWAMALRYRRRPRG